MASLATVAEDSRLLGRPTGELSLRVASGQQAGEVYHIAAQKCTLGTDESCTVRFDLAGLRPLHCLILRGEAQTVVRRWSSDTRLNGSDFTDAALRSGDRLSLGSLDLEIVFPEALPPEAMHEARTLLDKRSALDDRLQRLGGEASTQDEDHSHKPAEQTAERSDLEQEVNALKLRLADLDAQRRLDEANLNEQATLLQVRQDELVAERAELERRAGEARRAAEQFEQHRQSVFSEIERREAELDERERAQRDRAADETSRKAEAIDQERQIALDDFERREAEIAQREQAFQADRAKLDAQRTALHAEQAAFHAERDGWEEVQEEARTRLSDKMQQLERRLSELNIERTAWEADRDRSLADFAEQSQTLSRKLANLEADRRALLSERAAWQTEQHQRETQWTGRQRTLAAAEEDLALRKSEAEQREQQLAAREAQLSDAEEQRAAQEAQLAAGQRELDDRRKSFEEERLAWESQRGQDSELDRQALTAAEAEAARLRSELAAAVEQTEQVRAAESEAQQRRVAAEEKLAGQQAALAAARQALEQERLAWETRQNELPATDNAEAARLAEAEISRLHDDLEAQRSALAEAQREHAAATDEIARQQSELEAARRSFDDERAAWQSEQADQAQSAEAEQTAFAQQAAADRERLAALEAELDSLRRAWDEERQTWHADAERRIAQPVAGAVAEPSGDLQSQLLELTTELENARRALDDDRRHWEAERLRQQAELAEHAAQLQELRQCVSSDQLRVAEQPAEERTESPEQTLDDSQQRVEAMDLLGQFAGQDSEQVSFAEPVDGAPVNTADLLSQFGISLDMAPDDTGLAGLPGRSSAGATSEGDDSNPVDNTAAAQPAKPHAEEEEDSIDAYMARLMQRLGSKSPAPAPRAEAPAPNFIAPSAPERVEPEPLAEPSIVTKLTDPSEMGRRALPPERAADLSAMRELANLNARSAIDKHQQRTIRSSGMNKAAVALAGALGAIVESVYWLQGSATAFYLMLGSTVVALFWGWQYAAVWRQLGPGRQESAPRAPGGPPAIERRVAERRAVDQPPAEPKLAEPIAADASLEPEAIILETEDTR